MGNVRVDNDVLEFYNSDGTTRRTVLRPACPLRPPSRVRLSTGTIDDAWSGGSVGLFRASSSTTTTLQWHDFKCGMDNNADGDLDDAADYVYASYDFNDPQGSTWQQLSLSHDDNGDLTADGLLKFKYDAWNRLVGVWYNAGDMSVAGQRVATYAYDGLPALDAARPPRAGLSRCDAGATPGCAASRVPSTEKLVANRGPGVVYKFDAGGFLPAEWRPG